MNAPHPRLCLLLALCVAPLRAEEPLEAVEKSASEWVKLRVESTRLDTDWRAERELVTSLATTLKERAAALEEKRDLAKAKTAQEREELAAMQAKNGTAVVDLQAFEARLNGLATRLIALRPALPPRLSEALEMSYRTLTESGVPVGERMQVAMTVLNRCTQFNRIVTAGEDVLTLEGEAGAKSYAVIYWGLSHGYAVDRAARKAWLGRAAAGQWRWEARPEAFDAVMQLVAVANDKADPDFVTVPAVVARSVPATSNR